MEQYKKGSIKLVIPAGAEIKKGELIKAGQSGGDPPPTITAPNPTIEVVLTILSDIKNEAREGNLVIEYEYDYTAED